MSSSRAWSSWRTSSVAWTSCWRCSTCSRRRASWASRDSSALVTLRLRGLVRAVSAARIRAISAAALVGLGQLGGWRSASAPWRQPLGLAFRGSSSALRCAAAVGLALRLLGPLLRLDGLEALGLGHLARRLGSACVFGGADLASSARLGPLGQLAAGGRRPGTLALGFGARPACARPRQPRPPGARPPRPACARPRPARRRPSRPAPSSPPLPAPAVGVRGGAALVLLGALRAGLGQLGRDPARPAPSCGLPSARAGSRRRRPSGALRRRGGARPLPARPRSCRPVPSCAPRSPPGGSPRRLPCAAPPPRDGARPLPARPRSCRPAPACELPRRRGARPPRRPLSRPPPAGEPLPRPSARPARRRAARPRPAGAPRARRGPPRPGGAAPRGAPRALCEPPRGGRSARPSSAGPSRGACAPLQQAVQDGCLEVVQRVLVVGRFVRLAAGSTAAGWAVDGLGERGPRGERRRPDGGFGHRLARGLGPAPKLGRQLLRLALLPLVLFRAAVSASWRFRSVSSRRACSSSFFASRSARPD